LAGAASYPKLRFASEFAFRAMRVILTSSSGTTLNLSEFLLINRPAASRHPAFTKGGESR